MGLRQKDVPIRPSEHEVQAVSRFLLIPEKAP
jgi:hypothetical protein